MAWTLDRSGPRGKSFTGVYRDLDGRQRSVSGFKTRREAQREAERQENLLEEGRWFDVARSNITFKNYVIDEWLPHKHLEPTTRAAYLSNCNKHFFPAFGDRPLGRIPPTTIQAWVTTAVESGLSARSIRKYHVMLSSIFERAVRDGMLPRNPCAHTEMPKVRGSIQRTLTPEEFEALLEAIPPEYSLLVETAIETGARWGEAIALRPRHIDFLNRRLTIEETVQEVTKKISPTGQRYLFKPYPKSGNPRRFAVTQDWVNSVSRHIAARQIGRDDLLFATSVGTPISRNTFRSRVWLPAVAACGIDFPVRFHDLRHAHASWLLAGGSDLKSVMDRMGHAQIQTTQRYLHAFDDADDKNLEALISFRGRSQRQMTNVRA